MKGLGRLSTAVLAGLVAIFAFSAKLDAGIGGWTFVRGDADVNGTIELADGVFILNYLFVAGSSAPQCEDAADVNDDGTISLVDGVYVLSFLFASGPAPAAPWPACGVDISFDGLGCDGPVTGCPEADVPPNIVFSFADDLLEDSPGIRMHPNADTVTAGNFDELSLYMRPLSLQGSSDVTLSITGNSVEFFELDGTPVSLPANFLESELPVQLLANGTNLGSSQVTLAGSAGLDVATVNTSLFPGLAGDEIGDYPHFEYARSFNDTDNVQSAIEPSRYAARDGLTYRVYVVESKTPAEWAADNSLVDVSGGFETATVNGSSIVDNVVDAWPNPPAVDPALIDEEYDIVYDFGLDGTFDPGDIIDGFSNEEPGFWVVKNLNLGGPLATSSSTYSLPAVPGSLDGERTYWPTDIDTLGQLPLVIISHGNGHQYTWYDYLGNHLASHGYVVMSHQNLTGPGIDTASNSTLDHTQQFLASLGTIAGGVLSGHIQTDNISWIGHSRGGEGVARAYDKLIDGVANPTQYDENDIRYVSSIAPTVFLGTAAANPHGVNYHLLAGAADGDVNGGPSCALCQFFRIHMAGTGNTAATYVQGADHNDFNCCGFDDYSGPFGGAIGRPQAQIVAKSYYLALCEYWQKGNEATKDYLTRNYSGFRPSGIAASTVVANQWNDPADTNHVIDDFQTQTSTATSSSGQPVSATVSNLQEGVLNDNNTSFTWTTTDPFNGMTQASSFPDNARGNVFDYSVGNQVDIDYTVAPGERDFSDDPFITLRACQGTRHPRTVSLAGTNDFTVTLVDGSGTESSINFGSYGGLTRPFLRTGSGSGAGWANEYNIVRLRVADFENDGTGIDLSDITNVRLEFGSNFGSSQGRLGVDDLQLTND